MSLSREDQRGDHVDEVAPYRRTPKVRYLMVFNGMVAQPAPAREDFMRSLIVAAVVAVASLYCAAPATAAPAPINGPRAGGTLHTAALTTPAGTRRIPGVPTPLTRSRSPAHRVVARRQQGPQR